MCPYNPIANPWIENDNEFGSNVYTNLMFRYSRNSEIAPFYLNINVLRDGHRYMKSVGQIIQSLLLLFTCIAVTCIAVTCIAVTCYIVTFNYQTQNYQLRCNNIKCEENAGNKIQLRSDDFKAQAFMRLNYILRDGRIRCHYRHSCSRTCSL